MTKKEKVITYIWLMSIVIIIFFGVFLIFQRPSTDVVSAYKELLETSDKVRTHYKNKPDYWGLNTTEAVKNKLFSGKLTNNQIINSLGKYVIIGGDISGNTVMPRMRSFVIGYKDLTQKECIELASFIWKESDKLGLLSVQINTDNVEYNFDWGEDGLPLSRSKAKQFCGEVNSLVWIFE